MDSCSSWEKLNIKTRKPYTITKQRERWTEDEHSWFLEALKLYGRAWQRIEEHIGTKTAVQIRSHAQKFFTKLEKEAIAKGVPIGQAYDLEIPPPHPKRKPNYPYPRKTHTQDTEKPETSVSSLQKLHLERKPLPEKTSHTKNLENEKTSVEAQNDIEGPCASLFLENEKSLSNESCITIETRKQDDIKRTNINSSHLAYENIIQGRYSDKPVNLINDTHGKQTYPRQVPVQVVDVHQQVGAKTSDPIQMSFHESEVNKLGEVHEHPDPPNLFVKSSTIPSLHPLFTSVSDNNENYRSFLHVSSTTSSVIVSSLLQNPAAHAAASFAAKFYHPENTEASSADSFSRDQLNPGTTPSMAAIAAATVAAATAWWSTHGLLPVCTPFHPGGYSCTFQTPIEENQVRVVNTGRDEAPSEGVLQEEKMDADIFSSGEPEKKLNSKETLSSKTNVGKQIDRSSCGSNTTSSSETEMDGLEKDGKETEETKGSWKEPRLAFQALFSRQVAETSQQSINKNGEFDLNGTSQQPGESNSNGFVVLRGEEGVLRMGLRSVKVNFHHTGFRPYKRCSIEAKESSKIMIAASTGNQNDNKG